MDQVSLTEARQILANGDVKQIADLDEMIVANGLHVIGHDDCGEWASIDEQALTILYPDV